MVTTVNTEAQLNTALANNSDDIVFGNDITVTEYHDYVFSHEIDGKGYKLILNIPSSSQGSHWAFLNSFTGEMHHLEVTGVINVTDINYANNGAPMFAHMGANGYIHDIIIDALTISGNFTKGASWALFGNPDSQNSVIENIWINNFKVDAQTSNARFHIVGRGATVDRISISNSNSIFPVSNQWSYISNGYIYNSNLNHAPAINGAAYYASNGNDLYVHSNVTWSGATRSESDSNGRVNDTPDFEHLGFTTANGWTVSSGYPQLNVKPTPIITNVSASPTTGAVTTELTLSATVQDATSYQWQYSTNGGSTWTNISGATAASATWTPGAVGTYQVHLVATNASGSTTSDPVTVTIYDVPTVTATASPTQGPLTQQITLSATVTDPAPGVTTYQWEVSEPGVQPWTSIPGATTKTYQYSYSGSATTKYFRLVATGVGGAGYSNTISYTAYDAPTAVASALPPIGTHPLQISYSVETTGDVQSYQWELKVDGGAWEQLSTTASGTYIASAIGTYQFRVTVTGYGGSTTSNIATVAVIDQGVKITAPPEGSNIFVGFPVNFTCTVAAVTNPVYSWSDGHTTPSFTKTFDTAGAQTMSVTVTGDEGTFTASVSFNIVAREDFSITAPSTFVNNVPVTFTASNEPDSVVWHFPNSETESGFTVTKAFSGYSKGTLLNVTAVGTFTDDLNNSYETTHSVALKCVYPYSYYENPRGEKFYFDEYCTILRAGKSGFSEIQVNTDIVSGHDYNIVSGLTVNNRVITFNVFVKGAYAAMHAKRREMVHIMAPQKELGTFSYTRDDGEIFTMRCNIALGSPIFADEAVSNGWVGTISFIAPNGVWEGAEVTASTDNFISNDGDIPCGFEATLTGNLVNATNSESMLATSGTLSGYKINTTDGIVTKEVDGEWVDAWEDVSLNSTLVVLEVGNNTITGCSSITFKPLYLGV